MTLNPANISAHITSRTSTPYTLLHATIMLCKMLLHREYLPFVPLRCSKPSGPLDPPLFPDDKYAVPPGFWEHSASECFKSARDLMDLLRTCQEWGVLVETPIVGFAIYVAACVGKRSMCALSHALLTSNRCLCDQFLLDGYLWIYERWPRNIGPAERC